MKGKYRVICAAGKKVVDPYPPENIGRVRLLIKDISSTLASNHSRRWCRRKKRKTIRRTDKRIKDDSLLFMVINLLTVWICS